MAAAIDLSGLGSLEEQVYVSALQLQKMESEVPEEERPDQASADFSVEDNNVTLTITLETETNIENGKAVISAKPYLSLS